MDEKILLKLDDLLNLQMELNVMMRALADRPVLPEQEEVWYTKDKVLDELCIAPRTFYRRRKTENWTCKKSGGRVYYLRSSLMKD